MPDHPAPEHHRDPVAQRQHLVQLGGDEQHGRPAVALVDYPAVDVLDRADVEAPGGLGGHQERDRAGKLPGDHDLLLVAPGQGGHALVDRTGPDVELPQLALAVVVHGGEVAGAEAGVGLLVVDVEHEVVGDRHRQHQPVHLAVFGDVGDPGSQCLARAWRW